MAIRFPLGDGTVVETDSVEEAIELYRMLIKEKQLWQKPEEESFEAFKDKLEVRIMDHMRKDASKIYSTNELRIAIPYNERRCPSGMLTRELSRMVKRKQIEHVSRGLYSIGTS